MTGRLWYVFGACAAALVASMIWVSDEMLELEVAETDARADAKYQERLRLALNRLDYKFSRLLAPEADRDPLAYRSFFFQKEAWRASDLKKIREKEVLAQSPLLRSKPDYIRLHFQMDAAGRLTSPQVPTGPWTEKLQDYTPDAAAAELQRVEKLMDAAELSGRLSEAQKQTAVQTVQSRRAQVAARVKKGLEPIWQKSELLFLRRVTVDDQPFFQGFLVDWPRLHAILVKEIEDLFPAARLLPVVSETDAPRLFTLPVALDVPRPARAATTSWTATHTVLAVTWGVIALALLAVGLALRKSMEFGERQRRFASLVTHELRSPLTTFRLYSDLLAEGMVTESGKRDVYHRTLQKESDQMTRMVENVIAHSRLEEGRAKLQLERLLLGNLLEKITPDLEQCTQKGSLALTVDVAAAKDTPLETDPAAVGQILFNLVDNACKYARAAVHIGASTHAGTLRLTVRDHGPGVPPAVARRIFRPFERGQRDETDPERGLGLGLALSRGLARDLGGDLTLEPPAGGGACFVLTLPIAA